MRGSKFAEAKSYKAPEWYIARKVLRERHIKLVDMAAHFGLTPGGMHRVVNGVPNIEQVKKMADFIGVDFSEMFDFSKANSKK